MSLIGPAAILVIMYVAVSLIHRTNRTAILVIMYVAVSLIGLHSSYTSDNVCSSESDRTSSYTLIMYVAASLIGPAAILVIMYVAVSLIGPIGQLY